MTIERPRILFIDDSAEILTVYENLLPEEEYFVSTESTGSKGIETAIQLNPHVIFVDIVLSDMDGVDVSKKILNSVPNNNIKPVIYALTNYSLDEIREEIENSGIHKCISKPFYLAEFRNQIKDAVNNALSLLENKNIQDC